MHKTFPPLFFLTILSLYSRLSSQIAAEANYPVGYVHIICKK